VWEALQSFQNEDGGFGHAIEPDFRYTGSSALATTVGLQHLSRLGADADNPLVRKAIQYLSNTFNPEITGWESIPREVDDFPRAIWWNYQEPTKDLQAWSNPNPEIIGYLNEFKGMADDEFVATLTQYALDCLYALPDKLEMHVLLCYLRMAERLPQKQQEIAYAKLDRAVQLTVSTNPDEWTSYCLVPLQVMHSPQSRYASMFDEAVQRNLDVLIDTQGEDGAWSPTWHWGRFEEHWEIARREWKGILTLENLRLLRAFGRIESPVDTP
jgi:hypothetical protein